jgi:glycosyltransferase involved in cell wall biosynthesis
VNESFSIIIMEAWLCKSPVIVHSDCEVTKGHCIRSNGGLYFNNYYEFEAIIDLLINDKKISEKMGYNGRKYVVETYNWDTVIKRFFNALNGFKND